MSSLKRREFVQTFSASLALTMLACRRQKSDFLTLAIPKEFTQYDKPVNFYTHFIIDNYPIGLNVTTKNEFVSKINPYENHILNDAYINQFLQTEIYHLFNKNRLFKPKLEGIKKNLDETKIDLFKKMNDYINKGNQIEIWTSNTNSLFYEFIRENFSGIFLVNDDSCFINTKGYFLDFCDKKLNKLLPNYFSFTVYPNDCRNNIPLTHFLESWGEVIYDGNLFTQQPIQSKININSISEFEFIFDFLKSRDEKKLIDFTDYFSFYKYLIIQYLIKNINKYDSTLIDPNIRFFDTIKNSYFISNFNIIKKSKAEIDSYFEKYLSNPFIENLKFKAKKNSNPPNFEELFKPFALSKNQIDINNNYQYLENKFGLEIDLNLCNGCGECIISCQIENNIPYISKEEIEKDRSLHWININEFNYNNKIHYFPLMCQHCDNAPCESVCPVNASTHSPEGLNETVYNRCIGTRYCMANCPYKVRKFNFYQYSDSFDELNSAFNPNVTVRERGIVEKCTLCIQRIQSAKRSNENTHLDTKNIKTACQEICPQKAIRLINFKYYEIDKSNSFVLFPQFNTKPSIIYLFNKY